ncbi:acyltransferase family protein [Gluconacetobacter sp. Hr-1-5]|uniref:acyltransferase family protein n=1 Tax=Gluconacetobacter sp. Hr-1-5 TaxID=3395370 RepID=UPI003B521C10
MRAGGDPARVSCASVLTAIKAAPLRCSETHAGRAAARHSRSPARICGQALRPIVRGRRPDFGRFFFRRLLRTLPAYVFVVLVYLLFPALRETPILPPAWEFFTFTENLLVHLPPSKAFSQVWSLCVEEQFYLVLPLAVACLSLKPTPARVGAAILGTLLMGVVVRGVVWFDIHDHFFPAYQERIYYPTWTRLDDLLFGVGAATIRAFRPHWWRRIVKISGCSARKRHRGSCMRNGGFCSYIHDSMDSHAGTGSCRCQHDSPRDCGQ